MKDAKQYNRSVADIAARLRKLLAECAPAVQAKYGLQDDAIKLANYAAAATVAVECANAIGGSIADEHKGGLADVLNIEPIAANDS